MGENRHRQIDSLLGEGASFVSGKYSTNDKSTLASAKPTVSILYHAYHATLHTGSPTNKTVSKWPVFAGSSHEAEHGHPARWQQKRMEHSRV